MKVIILDATGALGRHVLPRLIERGHQIRAVIRKQHDAAFLRELGADTILANDRLIAARFCGRLRDNHWQRGYAAKKI
jgi:uncharacterized protein YbjT (DUF2867 family)